MLLSLARPSIYLSLSMVAWGIASGATGAMQDFSDLAACRFISSASRKPLSSPAARSSSAGGTLARSLAFDWPSSTALPCSPAPLAVYLQQESKAPPPPICDNHRVHNPRLARNNKVANP
ncbi:uncharacterized protein BDV17DRAFT_166606 [Aspergillus undulatus]|uniref:uncharacterized protein n=1 Tax=Aspergillus undulatus TaxID=1810928 RepID=UPI003CCDB539